MLGWHVWRAPRAFSQPGSSRGQLRIRASGQQVPRWGPHPLQAPVPEDKTRAPVGSSAIIVPEYCVHCYFFQRRYSDLVWLVVTKVFLCLVVSLPLCLLFYSRGIYYCCNVTKGALPPEFASQYFPVENSTFFPWHLSCSSCTPQSRLGVGTSMFVTVRVYTSLCGHQGA